MGSKKFFLSVFFLVFAVHLSANAYENKRVALVIGNGEYRVGALKNPVNDAADIAAKLRGYGFHVILRKNLTSRTVGSALNEFKQMLSKNAVALVFYAGHGMQIEGKNFLPFVDAEIEYLEDIPSQSLALGRILDIFEGQETRLNLVFLDACRNNPFSARTRNISRGLARELSPSGTLISYATRPGGLAADGGGRNGVFTGKFLEAMAEYERQPVEQVLKEVTKKVLLATKGSQEPWFEASITGNFCFGGCSAATQSSIYANVSQDSSVKTPEEVAWDAAVAVNTQSGYSEFLKSFPDGGYAPAAQIRLDGLKSQPLPPVDKDTERWEQAVRENTLTSFKVYVIDFPYGKYLVPAERKIRKLVFGDKSDSEIVEMIRKIEYRTKGFYDKISWEIDGYTLIYEAKVYSNNLPNVIREVQAAFPGASIKGAEVRMKN